MSSVGLYTITLEFYDNREVWIEQLSIPNQSPRDVLSAWGKLATEHNLISRRENKLIQEELDDAEHTPVLLNGLSNIWYASILLDKDHFGIHVIETSTSVSPLLLSAGPDVLDAATSRALRKALEKYATYQEQHERLKGIASLSKAVHKERKKAEKQLLYWRAKTKFLRQGYNRDATSEEETLYTVTMYYRGGTYIRQFSWILGNDLQFILFTWLSDVFLDIYEAKIIAPQDRLLLMEKASQSIYSPVPVDGCTNVWGTYFSLSGGMAKITIIKTALDEVVQG